MQTLDDKLFHGLRCTNAGFTHYQMIQLHAMEWTLSEDGKLPLFSPKNVISMSHL